MRPFTRKYFASFVEESRLAAQEIVPLVINLIHPRSVIDVGCGLGIWLAVFRAHGVTDLLGVDGDYIERDQLCIPPENVLTHDLRQGLRLERKFDLVVSVEVAHHLPPNCAATFVDSLTSLGSVVLFSAAIPFQGGDGHYNEQWPDYWATLFSQHDYVPIDCIRRRVWQNKNVVWWYSQNSFLYVRQDYLRENPLLQEELEKTGSSALPLVHPLKYLDAVNQQPQSLRRTLSLLPRMTVNALVRKVRRWGKRK